MVPMLPSYRNQSIDFLCKSFDWFLYEGNAGIYYSLMDQEIHIFCDLDMNSVVFIPLIIICFWIFQFLLLVPSRKKHVLKRGG